MFSFLYILQISTAANQYACDSNKNNDYVYIQDSNQNFKQYIISLDEFGDITLLSSTSDLVIDSVVLGLDPVINPPISLRFYLRNGMVTLYLPAFSFTVTSVVAVANLAPKLTDALLPASGITSFNEYIFITESGNKSYGGITIDSSGSVYIGPTTGNSSVPFSPFSNGVMGWENSRYVWPLDYA